MKLLPFVTLLSSAIAQNCQAHVRKEWRELSSSDQDAFFNAVNTLKKAPSQLGQPNRYDDFAYLHSKSAGSIHGNCRFLNWHRAFLFVFEQELSRVAGKQISLPYWQWSIDSQAPEKSPLLQPNAFGTGGNAQGCVVDGKFANWKNADGSCLNRGYRNGPIASFYSGEHCAAIVQTTDTVDTIWRSLEGVVHGSVHNSIGGDMATMTSPRDPLFFLRKYQLISRSRLY